MPTPDAFQVEHIKTVISAARVKAFTLYLSRAMKTKGAFESHIWADMRDLFTGTTDEYQFIDAMVSEIENQYGRAWREGAKDADVLPADMSEDDLAELDQMVKDAEDFIPKLTDDILKARDDGKTAQDFSAGFRGRAEMWASKYDQIVGAARLYFGNKEKYVWVFGATEKHCHTGDNGRPGVGCADLANIVAYASEWAKAGITAPPSGQTNCGGFNCDCRLEPTKKRRTANALGRLMDIMTAANV